MAGKGTLNCKIFLPIRYSAPLQAIRAERLPLADDGTVVGGAEKLCEILDVAGIIDLTASDDMAPPPAGLATLRPQAAPIVRWPRLGMPIRGAASPLPQAHLVTTDVEGDAFDPVALLGLGHLTAHEKEAWEEAGQPISVAGADSSLIPQIDGLAAIGMTATSMDEFVGTSAFMVSTALVWVVPDEFQLGEIARDLAGFWNHRALRLQHRGTRHPS